MVDAAPVLTRLEAETETMIAETTRLAELDSGSGDDAGIRAVCDRLGEILVGVHGFVVTPRVEGGLSATLSTGHPGERVLVVGHADTVWPAGTVAGWSVQRQAELLSGPGVGDMKACLVMAAHAVSAARATAGLRGIAEIELLVVPDEELGSVGSRGWIEDRALGAAACLGLEAAWPGGGVDVERGAVGAITVTAYGRAAHAAGHEGTGVSAVAALAPLVGELEALSRPQRGMLVTVGIFRGGTARQVVSDLAQLSVDLRAPETGSAQRLLARIDAIVQRADAAGETRVVRSGGITRPAMPRAASDELYALMQARASALHIPIRPVSSRGGSDASFPAALGVPTIDGLGPVCHDSCARGERIEIASLAQRGALMALLLCDLGETWASRRDQARSGKVDAPE
jgi:glutamate carboxypeptidase